MSKTLNDLRPGDSGTVLKLLGEGPIKRRLMDMGVTKGTEIKVEKVAPLGDPIQVTLRGYHLSFRKSEAQNILIN